MTEVIIAAVIAALKDPTIRGEIEKLVFGAVALVLHRSATDPNFLANADAAFAARDAAKTPEELVSAQQALQKLLAS